MIKIVSTLFSVLRYHHQLVVFFLSFEFERNSNDTDSKNPHFSCCLRNNRSSTCSSTSAHSGSDEDHAVSASKNLRMSSMFSIAAFLLLQELNWLHDLRSDYSCVEFLSAPATFLMRASVLQTTNSTPLIPDDTYG